MLPRLVVSAIVGVASAQQFFKLESRKVLPRAYGYYSGEGYHPEFGGCSAGVDCEDACGSDYLSCDADTDLALFCYNPEKGQQCCNDGTGKSCDDGYRCRQGGGQTWCCPSELSDLECDEIAPTLTPEPGSTTPSSTPTQPATRVTTTELITTTLIETLWTTVVKTEASGSSIVTVTESYQTTIDVTSISTVIVTTTEDGNGGAETDTVTEDPDGTGATITVTATPECTACDDVGTVSETCTTTNDPGTPTPSPPTLTTLTTPTLGGNMSTPTSSGNYTPTVPVTVPTAQGARNNVLSTTATVLLVSGMVMLLMS
ncbi:uncharacterized protein MKZ38_004179 [Zalerion maritima]|uniref:Uncharacterized protein n=1 Tax=Zalerion maritima TaxID=339359 RepID=A0AAD5WQ46_9PEZI|nr:uncharacterized protein MKZ38_004179 [Zalerion maritima]